MRTYDAIVVGAGGIGSSAAFHLAKRGARVLAIERFSAAHDRGSSHGETRVIRQAYFEHPDYVPLLRRAYELWSELEERLREPLLYRVGLLEVGPADGIVVPGVLHAARLHGLEVDELTAMEASKRFPGFRIPEGMSAVFECSAGYLKVEQCVLAHFAEAELFGAEFLLNTRVQSWQATPQEVKVTTDAGEFRASKLVITAGPWAPQLNELGVPMQVLRKHLYWFTSNSPAMHQDHGCPTYLFEMPEGVFYGFPQIDALGVKVAEHSGGTVVDDPATDPRLPDEADQRRVEQFLKGVMPRVDGPLVRQSVCFYTMSPDGHFIVDRHPEHENVVFAAGLSGHGFKFASALGEVLANLAIDGRTEHAIDFLRLSRFASGKASC